MSNEEDRENIKNFRNNSKKNASFAEGYVRKIVDVALINEKKIAALDVFFSGFLPEVCKATARELNDQRVIREESLYGFK